MSEMTWPPSAAEIEDLHRAGETDLVEFKRQWPDLTNADGKARLAKSVMALANTVPPDRFALLIFGLDEHSLEWAPSVSPTLPSQEAVQSILAAAIVPPTRIRHARREFRGREIDVLGIELSPVRPHYAGREIPGVLSLNLVYVRRGRTVSALTPPEIDALYSEGRARASPPPDASPLRWGFVHTGQWDFAKHLTLRIRNSGQTPVVGVNVLVDVVLRRDPSVLERQHLLTAAILQSGEARDVPVRLDRPNFYKVSHLPNGARSIHQIQNFGTYIGDRWLDVTAQVSYCDTDGLLRSEHQSLAVEA